MKGSRDLIKVISNFITKDEALNLRNFIDNNLSKFEVYQEDKRYAWRFGKDFLYKDSIQNFSIIEDNEEYFRHNIFLSIENLINNLYKDNNIVVSNLWFSKHYPGSIVPLHRDFDNGLNSQFKYSAVLYLNSLKDSGQLSFPHLNFKYLPEEGDLVLFPSQGDEFAHEVFKIDEVRYTIPIWTSSPEYSL